MKTTLEKNITYSEKFIQPIGNPQVPKDIKEIILKNKIKSMIDLGCGDGFLIYALKKEFPKIKIIGIDISPRRIEGLKKNFPKGNFLVKDVCNTGLKQKFDFVHSSQVLEHVPSDTAMIIEMKRLLKDEGVLFCSSVIKKSWAVYKYWNNGKFVLDQS